MILLTKTLAVTLTLFPQPFPNHLLVLWERVPIFKKQAEYLF